MMSARLCLWVAAAGVLPVLCAAATTVPQMPPGIGVRMTVEGPVFVDARGMTLYERRTPNQASYGGPCNNQPQTQLRYQADSEGVVNLKVAVFDGPTRKTCVEKHPPLRAPANAHPVGLWSAQRQADGAFQWAYDGELLYTSTKDRIPGDINGTEHSTLDSDAAAYRSPWLLASAPLPGAPGSITVAQTAAGPALANFAGQVLYYSDVTTGTPDPAHWQPLAAPVGASIQQLKDWSIATPSEGTRQWAYQGKALYTFTEDSDSPKDQVLADTFGSLYGVPQKGWHVALLMSAPNHPAEVTVHPIMDTLSRHRMGKRVYANRSGMTLYTVSCIEDTDDFLDCDDVGDSPRYWLNFCGGEQHCQETWHPLTAPADAKPIGQLWSVRVINPHHPWRAPQPEEQERVWAYRGRVVFTYSGDVRPGTYNGWKVYSTGVVQPRPILAYEPITQ